MLQRDPEVVLVGDQAQMEAWKAWPMMAPRVRLVQSVLHLGLPDVYVEHAKPAQMLAECGLDEAGIEASVRIKAWSGLVGRWWRRWRGCVR